MEKPDFWKNSKRYYDLKSYWRNLFGCNVHKLQLMPDLPVPTAMAMWPWEVVFTATEEGQNCAKRDLPSVAEQIATGKKYYKPHASKFIAYFQTFTNTYASVENLRKLYDEALAQEDVIGLSIGTRPDCLGTDVIELLSEYAKKYHIWVELGLQSVHDKTLQFINRGHNFQQFLDAVNALAGSKLNICVHIIIGLPGESDEDVLRQPGLLLPCLYRVSKFILCLLWKEPPWVKCIKKEP